MSDAPPAAAAAAVSAPPAAAPKPAPDSFAISLFEFCTRHSQHEGPELLGAFYADECRARREGEFRTHDAHLAALTAFASRPVA